MHLDFKSLTVSELLAQPWIQQNTAVGDVARWLAETLEKNQADPLFAQRYRPMVEDRPADRGHPFLTVVMRTQLTRRDALIEALLCLMAQSDQDFEVALIPHRVTEETLGEIRAIVSGFDAAFSARVRILPLNEGNRTAPLNYGFANAWGEYVSVLDDDDIVLEHWVEDFHRAVRDNPGTVARSYAVNQDWTTVRTGDGEQALSAASAPRPAYCRPFSSFVELSVNRCPVFSLAFPAYAFQELGFIFDESLTTTEDWDFLRRVTAVCSVTDIPRVSGIYRLWTSGKTSHSQHREEEWKRNYSRILEGERRYPVILRRSQHEEGIRLGRLTERWEEDPEQDLNLRSSEKTIRDLESIIKAQRESIAALEGKGVGGRLFRWMKLVFHRIRGMGGGAQGK